MNNSVQRKKGAVLSYLSIIINTIVQITYTPFLIKSLGQSEYGLYSLIYSIIGYLTILDFGFGNAIIVYTAKYRAENKLEEEKKLHGMFKLIFIIIGIIAGILSIILYIYTPTIFGNKMTNLEIEKAKIMMLILGFNLFFTFSFSVYSSIISAYEKFVFQKIMAIVNTLLKPIIMIPLLLLGFKSISLSIVVTIINVFICLSNYLYCKKKLNVTTKFLGFDKILFKSIFSYSFFIFLAIIVDKVNYSVDQLILGAISGTIMVSIYAVASQLDSLFITLSTAISSVFLPKMSKMIANKANNSELSSEFIKIGRIQYYIIFFMCSCIVLFGKEFIMWWAGKEYETSYYVAIILIIPGCIPLIQNLGLSIMQAMNKYKFKAITSFSMTIVNIFISIILGRKYGAVGCAIGTAFALIVCNIILMNIYYSKNIGLNIKKFWLNIFRMTIPMIIPIIIIYIIKNFIVLYGIKSVIIYGSIYTILYCVVNYLFNINSYEKNLIKQFFLRKNN